jgi:hypothetical protein
MSAVKTCWLYFRCARLRFPFRRSTVSCYVDSFLYTCFTASCWRRKIKPKTLGIFLQQVTCYNNIIYVRLSIVFYNSYRNVRLLLFVTLTEIEVYISAIKSNLYPAHKHWLGIKSESYHRPTVNDKLAVDCSSVILIIKANEMHYISNLFR